MIEPVGIHLTVNIPGLLRGLHHNSDNPVISGLVVSHAGIAVEEMIGLLGDYASDFLAFFIETGKSFLGNLRGVVVDVDEHIEFRTLLLEFEHPVVIHNLVSLMLIQSVLKICKSLHC